VAQRQFALAHRFGGGAQRSATSSGVRSGSSVVISATLMPSATIATTVATGMRRPRMVSMPPITSGSTVIRSNARR